MTFDELSSNTAKSGRPKDCYCHTCGRAFHHFGIASHRAAHRRRGEDCKITFSNGKTYVWKYSGFATRPQEAPGERDGNTR